MDIREGTPTSDIVIGAVRVAEENAGADVRDELLLAAEAGEVGGTAAGTLGGRGEAAESAGGELGDEIGERVIARSVVGLGSCDGREEREGDLGELHG